MSDKPALHTAVEKDCLEDVLRLLESGIDVDERDRYGCTGLFFAKSGRMTRFLLEKGADVNANALGGRRWRRSGLSGSALICAADYDQIETASILLDHGADVDARDIIGSTALHYAKTDLMAKLLIRNGSRVDARDFYGHTPLLHTAVNLRAFGVGGVKNCDQLCLRKWKPMIEKVRVLLQNGADVNATDAEGLTALHRILYPLEFPTMREVQPYKANVNVVEELLTVLHEFGFNRINHRAFLIGTPLHNAILHGSDRLVQLLLDEGASITIGLLESNDMTHLRLASGSGLMYCIRLYFIRLKVAGLPVDEGNLYASGYREEKHANRPDRDLADALKIEKKCREEVDKLKSDWTLGKLSLYDMLLTRDPEYLLDRGAVVALNLFNSQEYPLYGDLIEKKFASDKKQTVFSRRGLDALHSILRTSKLNLPEISPGLERLILTKLSEEQEKLTQSDQRVQPSF